MATYKKTSASYTRYGLLNINNLITVRYTHEKNFLKVGLLQSAIVSHMGHLDRCDALVTRYVSKKTTLYFKLYTHTKE